MGEAMRKPVEWRVPDNRHLLTDLVEDSGDSSTGFVRVLGVASNCPAGTLATPRSTTAHARVRWTWGPPPTSNTR